MMRNEKSGGHSERSVGIGTIEVAVWDAVAKIEDKPLHRVLADRYNGGKLADKVFCYVGGGWYAPGETTKDVQDEMRRHLDAGYTMLKMKVGGLPLAEDMKPRRGGEDRSCRQRHASSRSTPTASSAATRRWPTPRRWRRSSCAGSRSRAIRSTTRLLAEIGSVYDGALSTGENLFSTQDVENLVRFGGLKAGAQRRDPGRSAAGLRHRAIRPHRRHAGAPRLAAQRPVPARRQPDVARHRRRLRAGRRGILPRRVRRVRRLRRRSPRWRMVT